MRGVADQRANILHIGRKSLVTGNQAGEGFVGRYHAVIIKAGSQETCIKQKSASDSALLLRLAYLTLAGPIGIDWPIANKTYV
jgi:hypothetical protein